MGVAVEVEGGEEEAAVEEGKGVSAAVGVVKASVLSPPIPQLLPLRALLPADKINVLSPPIPQRLSLRALLPANPPVPSVH